MKPIFDRTLSVAALTVGGAALVFATTLVRALTVETASADPSSVTSAENDAPAKDPAAGADMEGAAQSATGEAAAQGATSEVEMPKPRVPSERPLQADEIQLAVDNDPFRPDRQRAAPYRMPDEMVEELPVRRELPPPPDFRVLGIVEQQPGGVALMQVEDATPRVLGVGETWMGYRLERVAGTVATMVSGDRTLELAVAPPSPQTARPQRAGRGGRNTNAGRGNNNTNARGNAAAAQAERIRAIVEQLRGQGAPGEVIERLMQQMVERGIEMPPLRVEVRRRDDDTMNLRMPQPRDR